MQVQLNDHFVAQFRELEREVERLRNGPEPGHAASASQGDLGEMQQQLLDVQRRLVELQDRFDAEHTAKTALEVERRKLQEELERTRREASRSLHVDALETALAEAHRENERLRDEHRRASQHNARATSSAGSAEVETLRRDLKQLRELLAKLPENWRSNPATLGARLVRLEELEEETPRLKSENLQLQREIYRLKNAKPNR